MEDLLARHHRGVLFFSAGKDSLATLLLLKEHWSQLDIVWSNPGAPYPEVVTYMEHIRKMVPSFIEVTGKQPEWIASHGWPVDVVPARYTSFGENGAGPAPIKFQPYFSCCNQNMWLPMQRYLNDSGHTLVVMGQRREETLRNRFRDERLQVLDGIEYFQPINDWTAREVLNFIADQGMPLPPFYEDGAESSADCWSCTAYLDPNKSRLQRMKDKEPKRWEIVGPVLLATRNAIDMETRSLLDLTQGMQS